PPAGAAALAPAAAGAAAGGVTAGGVATAGGAAAGFGSSAFGAAAAGLAAAGAGAAAGFVPVDLHELATTASDTDANTTPAILTLLRPKNASILRIVSPL